MVAKIGRGQSLFAALAYNQNKVEQGTARVIASQGVAVGGRKAMQRMMLGFESRLAANRRTEKPILHISLNPSPRDVLTDERLAALAGDYLSKMGYGDQPYVVFLHEDTGRRHVHIVTTCLDEAGHKLNDRYEWHRSMTACRELEREYGLINSAAVAAPDDPRLRRVDPAAGDIKRQVANVLKAVVAEYRFQSFGELNAVLACYNIEAKQVRGEYEGAPYLGIVYTVAGSPPIKSSRLGKQFGVEALGRVMTRHARDLRAGKWTPAMRDAVRLAMLTCRGDRTRFEHTMRGKGIDAIFRTSAQGRIYGATFIDHAARQVCNGSRMGADFSANAFEQLFAAAPAQSVPAPELWGIEIWSPPEPEPFEELVKRKKKKKKNATRR